MFVSQSERADTVTRALGRHGKPVRRWRFYIENINYGSHQLHYNCTLQLQPADLSTRYHFVSLEGLHWKAGGILLVWALLELFLPWQGWVCWELLVPASWLCPSVLLPCSVWPPVVSAASPSGPGSDLLTVPRLAEISQVSPGRFFDLQIIYFLLYLGLLTAVSLITFIF